MIREAICDTFVTPEMNGLTFILPSFYSERIIRFVDIFVRCVQIHRLYWKRKRQKYPIIHTIDDKIDYMYYWDKFLSYLNM